MRSAAAAAGIGVLEQTVSAVVQDEDSVRAGGLRVRWLVAADGPHSAVRASLLPPRPVRAPGGDYGSTSHSRRGRPMSR
ncbi:MAG: FAD-dependent monooxygenase [Sporichthyaceae bacterium]